MTRRGFTLIEMLLALAITAVVLAAVGGVVGRAAGARAAVARRVDALAGARLLFDLLSGEIEASLPGSLAVAVTDDAGAPALHLDLTTPSPDGIPFAVSYLLDGERLLRGTRPAFAGEDAIAREPVLDGVAALSVKCFDGTTWVTGWRGARPPRAVRLRLRTADGQTLTTTVAPALGRGA